MKLTMVALNAHFMHTNLAIRQILPTLSEFDVRFYEAHINLPYHELLERIAEGAPDVVAFSCYIWNSELVLRLCRALRLALPDVKIVLAGPEVAYRDAPIEQADYVLRGEGERSLAPLLQDLAAGRSPDLRMPEPMDPSDWTDPYADGIEGLEKRILYIETSRGCPFRCQFCLSSLSRGVRALPAGEATRRLTFLADRGAQLIKLVDRTFNFDAARANEIWAALIDHAQKTGYAGTYHFEIGAQLIDQEAIDLLARAPKGLFQFEIGVQSSDEVVLSHVSRSAPFARIADAVRKLAAAGNIHLHLDLIAGMPGDTLQSFESSFDDVFQLPAEQLQLGFLKLLHGSPLRRDAQMHGLTFDPTAPYEVICSKEMTFSELCHLKDVERVLDWFHNSGRYQNAMRWLLRDRAPFKLLSGMAKDFREKGVFDCERAEKARAHALLDTFDDPVLRSLIAHDLLSAGRRRDLPEALQFQEDEQQRALLRSRYHPVRGQSANRYPLDVLHFERTGELLMKETQVLYGADGAERI
ncbi:B12-binding domain-containing radical SAM protein [Eubacteriales bacterium OttesenSCG-928-N13]|nr:B12-binding domain-containing radical SAM protein [Eubacteriales bacterium OttesenSCG-928-N13]